MKFILLLLFSVIVSFSKETQFDPNPDESGPVAGSTPYHPYIGLPVTTWSIIQLNETERTSVCNNQTSFCKDQCGGDNYITTNFCNTTTMAWGCNCSNHIPSSPPYHWPIVVAECQGKESSCLAGCGDGVAKDICRDACSRYYKCDQAGGPKSGLRVDRPDQPPVYDVPVISNSLASTLSFDSYTFLNTLFVTSLMIYFNHF
ncbi:hypothetical protein G6F70_003839 [Rhizopus microsporus]|uniref:DUF7707 domain-containing protein n=2 Tax=Rhizopus TaxID=4842 RepID=A0A367K0G7_RHIAZ|nr:hypothetical protein G6F71_003815 [Rhizopus microsporus]RCH95635.1 hypothetical protein CU097_011516 [Rhizopus azygosporus]KAG1200684.1 hypothetical protein G6F70_003839 [Rhizopus microsporus]KAG1212438.1 hypothetical protein G6F69_003707 [Rhizopus microsporus]KAG1234493.1 hypothetical protein G6F67_003482 [Rhizopus microsporus]